MDHAVITAWPNLKFTYPETPAADGPLPPTVVFPLPCCALHQRAAPLDAFDRRPELPAPRDVLLQALLGRTVQVDAAQSPSPYPAERPTGAVRRDCRRDCRRPH